MASYACILYRVVTDYMPSAKYEAKGCMVLRRGDMLEVKSPIHLQDGTQQQPKGEYVTAFLLIVVVVVEFLLQPVEFQVTALLNKGSGNIL